MPPPPGLGDGLKIPPPPLGAGPPPVLMDGNGASLSPWCLALEPCCCWAAGRPRRQRLHNVGRQGQLGRCHRLQRLQAACCFHHLLQPIDLL